MTNITLNTDTATLLHQVALEELHDLKEVWSELSKVWEQIDQMKEQPWVSVQPRKVANHWQLFSHFKCHLFFLCSWFMLMFSVSSSART